MRYTLQSIGIFALAWFIFVIPFWGLTYTSDWAGYSLMFDEPDLSPDGLFRLGAIKLKSLGYTFIDLYRLHIIAIGFLYTLVFVRLRLNPILATLIVITLYYVPIGNQIRFYLAYPLVILSLYSFCRKQYIACLVTVILAILSHKTALILFLAYLCFYKESQKSSRAQRRWILVANVGIVILMYFFGFFMDRYSVYKDSTSSIFGGLYNLAAYLVPLYLIFKTNEKIQRFSNVAYTSFYRYIYTLSIGTSIFVFIGLGIQILTNRFISPLVPIWVAYFGYCSSISELAPEYRKRTCYYAIISLFIVYFKQYVVDNIIGGSHFFNEVSMMLLSYQL